MKLPFRRLAVTCIGLFILTAPVHSAVVPGQLLGLFSGTDSVAGILNNMGLGAVLLSTIEAPSSIGASNRDADYFGTDGLALNDVVATLAGDWSYEGPYSSGVEGWPALPGMSVR